MKKTFLLGICITFFCFQGCNSSSDNTPQDMLSDPYTYQQWYLDKNDVFYYEHAINDDAHIHLSSLGRIYSGKDVKVAVIDDGLDTNHPDLYKAVIASYDIKTKTTDVSPTYFNDYHGSAVTGIIAARENYIGVLGVAHNVSIIFLKYKSSMTESETIELFDKAEEFGADIISCSWGTYDVSDAVRDKIVDLSHNGRDGKGTLIVFAVGNDDYNLDDYNDESSIPEVIAVGATTKENIRAGYSNYGTSLDIVAPGGYYLSLPTLDVSGDRGENSGDYILYNGNFSGTSAAAPIVSGALALLLEENPDLTHDEVVEILHLRSDKIGNVVYDENGFNSYYGYGKLNVSNILNLK